MAKEADFYSPGEAARALGVPERQIFSMLARGELEGQQDEWARWRIPADSLRRARQDATPPSDPDDASEDSAETLATGQEAQVDPAATTIRSGHAPFQGISSSAEETGSEAAIRKADEAPPEYEQREHQERELSHAPRMEGGTETTRELPGAEPQVTPSREMPFDGPHEFDERLATDDAELRKLRVRLEHTEQARSRFEEEAVKLAKENERLRQELARERGKGFLERLFGGRT